MFKQLVNLTTSVVGMASTIVAFGWLVQYAFSDEIAEAEERDEVELDRDDNI